MVADGGQFSQRTTGSWSMSMCVGREWREEAGSGDTPDDLNERLLLNICADVITSSKWTL